MRNYRAPKTARRILSCVKDNPNIWTMQIAKKIGLPFTTVVYWTIGYHHEKKGRLWEDGLVEIERRGKNAEVRIAKGVKIDSILDQLGEG